MKKLKFFGCIIVSLGFMFLYAGTIQDGIVEQEIDIVQIIDEITMDQQVVEQKIKLFMYDECPYCVKVTNFLKQQNMSDNVELIDATIPENRELLRLISGRTQAPYLVDYDAGIHMPESLDIIAYLSKKFSVTNSSTQAVVAAATTVEGCENKKYTSSTFLSDVQASKKPVVILVSTTWCPPCKILKPIFLDIAKQYADACEFICIDGDEDAALVHKLGVQAYPSIVCYKDGKQINPKGYRSQEGLTKLIQQLIAN